MAISFKHKSIGGNFDRMSDHLTIDFKSLLNLLWGKESKYEMIEIPLSNDDVACVRRDNIQIGGHTLSYDNIHEITSAMAKLELTK